MNVQELAQYVGCSTSKSGIGNGLVPAAAVAAATVVAAAVPVVPAAVPAVVPVVSGDSAFSAATAAGCRFAILALGGLATLSTLA